MGRPKDEFLWDQVDGTAARWVCKHCHKEFVGTATRVRNHLSGAGNDISACQFVPSRIRDEALKKNTRKRRPSSSISPLRTSSSSTAAAPPPQHDPPPSSSNDPDPITESAPEDSLRGAFMKMLMTVGVFDAINHPTVREFLQRAHQHGVPLSLLGSDPVIIKKTLLNIKHEVERYMLMVKESWKTTGFTMITYNLSEKKENFASGGEGMDVIGFYCPKGFIFVRAPSYKAKFRFAFFKEALKQHVPSLEVYNLVSLIHHQCYWGYVGKTSVSRKEKFLIHGAFESDGPLCETSEPVGNLLCCGYEGFRFPCLRSQIQVACLEECRESEWANGLIDQAVRLHNALVVEVNALCEWYCTILAEKDKKMLRYVHEDEETKIREVHLSIFLLIMRLATDMQELNLENDFFGGYEDPEIMAIFQEPKFWIEGRKLAVVLTLTLRISDGMDTLVPTSGYLEMALHNVESVLLEVNKSSSSGITKADEAFHIWTCLRNTFKLSQNNVYSNLDPRYFLQEENVNVPTNDMLEILLGRVLKADEKVPQLRKDLERYRDVFHRFSDKIQLNNLHPVKLWEQYGHDLPLLQKGAIKLLSQPLTCMCNQVRKHIYQLQGSDDCILSLNVKMMEEFKILGDDIYNHPIDIDAREWIPEGLCTSHFYFRE